MTHQHTAEEIAEVLRQQIASRVLKFHDKVPSPEDLAQTWSVPKSVAGQAIAILREECLLDGQRRVTQPDWERARREVLAMRRAGLPIAGDRPAEGNEIKCRLRQCRNLAVWILRSESTRFPLRPQESCEKHRGDTREHMLDGLPPGLTIVVEPFQDPYERPSCKRRAQRVDPAAGA